MTTKNKVKNIVKSNLNQIYTTASNIAEEWGKKTIPIAQLNIILSKSKPSINTGNKELDVFNTNYNKTLDTLLDCCKTIAKNMDSKSIPLFELKKGLDLIESIF